MSAPSSRGIANAGPLTSRSPRRARSAHRSTLTGPVAWVDPEASLIVLRVESATRRGRRFVGDAVTVSLATARISAPDRNADGQLTAADILPGERVSIGVTLPAGADRLPALVAARTVACASFA